MSAHGYKPGEVTHLKIADDCHLGERLQKYNFEELPYKHVGGKDGNWDPSRILE